MTNKRLQDKKEMNAEVGLLIAKMIGVRSGTRQSLFALSPFPSLLSPFEVQAGLPYFPTNHESHEMPTSFSSVLRCIHEARRGGAAQ